MHRAATIGTLGGVKAACCILILLALSTTTACSAPAVSMQEGPREYVATDYDDVLGRWTRTEDLILFSELARALTVTATFEAWEFRWAYVIRYANDYRLTVAQRQRLLEQSLDETRKSHHFFVALYGGKYRQNDLTKPDGAWIVRLIDSTGNETAPEEISSIKKPSVLERRYYPYNTVWRRAFRVTFPVRGRRGRPTIAPGAEWVGLRFAGAKGNTDLIWELEPQGESTSTGLGGDRAAPRRASRSPARW